MRLKFSSSVLGVCSLHQGLTGGEVTGVEVSANEVIGGGVGDSIPHAVSSTQFPGEIQIDYPMEERTHKTTWIAIVTERRVNPALRLPLVWLYQLNQKKVSVSKKTNLLWYAFKPNFKWIRNLIDTTVWSILIQSWLFVFNCCLLMTRKSPWKILYKKSCVHKGNQSKTLQKL